ncbi:hypothetical protein JHK85_043140 [Glycine max]|nr:hypothetical protein JHK85_043140 [Glycine max]
MTKRVHAFTQISYGCIAQNDPKKELESISHYLGNKANPSQKMGSTNGKVKSNDSTGDVLGNKQNSAHKNGSKKSQQAWSVLKVA